jgi:rare lipoprotein A (peptidoglycan hydrolase)
VAHKGDKLPVHVAAQTAQSSPWMQVMQRFGALRGTSTDPALTSLLRIAKAPGVGSASVLALTREDIATASSFQSAQTEPNPETAAPNGKSDASLNNLAARIAKRLGSKLHTVFAGRASFYSLGQQLASGGKFLPEGLTAAHRTLPFGTRLRVTDQKSGRSVVVTVNDRGPYVNGRVLDLSLGAARALGMIDSGVIEVRAEVI